MRRYVHRPLLYGLDAHGESVPLEMDPLGEKTAPLAWAFDFDNPMRVVAQDYVGEALVSTVFLGIDHGFRDEPLVWETAVFRGNRVSVLGRYATRTQAAAGHARALEVVQSGYVEPE